MSLVRFGSPFDEFRKLENEISDLFRRIPTRDEDRTYFLPINVSEDSEKYVVEANVPGFTKDEVSIEATSQYLNIEINKSEEVEKTEEKYIIREISRSNYRRRISFDKPIDTTKAKTTLQNGILRIEMPKMEEAKSVKLIPEETE